MTPDEKNKPTLDPLIGRSIANRYQIEKKIGEGGIGSVYVARDKRMIGRKVVLKVLLDAWATHGETLRKFEHEKEALARLDHPAIVNILDSGTLDKDKPFFVMPYVEGRTLQQVLEEDGPPSLDACAQILESVCEALAAAHSKGVLHRDVKPANIMIGSLPGGKSRTLLIDFGIARVFESQTSPVTQEGRPLGTVLYVAPEQLEGDPLQTPAADVYSCGVVAYELLTGERPFKPASVYDMLRLQQEGPKLLPSDIDKKLTRSIDQFISKALRFNRDDRYQAADEFGDDLISELRRLSANKQLESPGSQITRPKVPLQGFSKMNTVAADARRTIPYLEPEKPSIEKPSSAQVLVPIAPNKTEEKSNQTETRDSRPTTTARSKLVPLAAVLVGVLLVLTGVLGWLFFRTAATAGPEIAREEKQPVVEDPAPVIAPRNRLQLYLLAKSTDKNAGASQPYRPVGTEVFSKDTGLAVNIENGTEGHLYLFSEDGAEPGKFYILFPTARQHEGKSNVAAGERIQTDFNLFEGPPGKDTIWIIWTKDKKPEFEAARHDAIRSGTVSDPAIAKRMRIFLRARHNNDVEVTRDRSAMTTTLASAASDIVFTIELAHK